MTTKISLFLPVYNEEHILEKHVQLIDKTLKNLGYNYEIVLVDDGSTDNTHLICKKLAKHDNISCLSYENGPSRRENLAKSFMRAKGNIIAFMDMDLATDLKYIDQLLREIQNGYDVSSGSRYVEGSHIQRTLLRRLVSFFYNASIRVLFNSTIRDHQCGFKAFKRDAILDIVKEMGYDSSFRRGWFWDAEMLIRAQRKSYKIVEFPVRWTHTQKSEFNFKREFRMIPYVLRLRKELK